MTFIASSRRATLLMLVLAASTPAAHACWEEAGRKYGINPWLLVAIARTESGLNPRAVNRGNGNGSYDVGLMQINSAWLPTLRNYGIDEERLFEPCTNITVGAWILAQNMRRLGATWEAVGAYNAASRDKRVRYAASVYRNLPPALHATASTSPGPQVRTEQKATP
jgi:soluble lytic murein transglycosylase-like protein